MRDHRCQRLETADVLVEVVILAIMMSIEPSPTLVRDTIYSAVMLDINATPLSNATICPLCSIQCSNG